MARLAGRPPEGAMSDSQRWLVVAGLAGGGWLVYQLTPVLTPFLLGALIAYLGDPLADRLEARGRSRTMAVVTVFVAISLVVLLLVLIMLPLLERQLVALVERLPAAAAWVEQNALPWLGKRLGMDLGSLGSGELRSALAQHWQQAGGVLAHLLGTVTRSGATLVAWGANLLLVPVVTFYLLRDWDVLVAKVGELVPRRYARTAGRLATECDLTLAAFFRGQLVVMLCLGVVYAIGLTVVGLDLGLLIGMTAGLASIVPYLGFAVGIVAAAIAALAQFHDVGHLVAVAVVFGIGQTLEGTLLTPKLVGDRIGLHPVAVIFAVLAGGQLFGFFGILLALPVAAVAMVLGRHAHQRYLASTLYRRDAAVQSAVGGED